MAISVQVVKVWDVLNTGPTLPPVLVAYKSVSVGKLFSIQFYPSHAFVLAAAGDKGVVAIWETDETEAIEQRFLNRKVDYSVDLLNTTLVESKNDVIPESFNTVQYDIPVKLEDFDDSKKIEKKKSKQKKK